MVGVGMVDLLCVVAGSVPADGCELSVRARQRGGRPHPPNRGRTAETGQENLGVSRASRSVAGHPRLRGRTAPGLAEGSRGAGVAGQPRERAAHLASGIAGHRPAGGDAEGSGGGRWISFGRGDRPHGEQADPERIWTSVLAVLWLPGGRGTLLHQKNRGFGAENQQKIFEEVGCAFSGGRGRYARHHHL